MKRSAASSFLVHFERDVFARIGGWLQSTPTRYSPRLMQAYCIWRDVRNGLELDIFRITNCSPMTESLLSWVMERNDHGAGVGRKTDSCLEQMNNTPSLHKKAAWPGVGTSDPEPVFSENYFA